MEMFKRWDYIIETVSCCLHFAVKRVTCQSLQGPTTIQTGLLKALVSWALTLTITGKDLPALILLFARETPGGCLEGFLLPNVDGFLK